MNDALAIPDDALSKSGNNITGFATAPRSDDRYVALWLHGRPASTVETYGRDVMRLRRFVGKPIARIDLDDLQAFADALDAEGLAPRTRARILSAAKSMLCFLARARVIPADVGVALRVPKIPSDLTARILSRTETRRLLRSTRTPRDAALLRVAYETGFRRAELRGLRWSSVALDEDSGDALLSVVGKGGKPRTVRIGAEAWALAAALRRPEDSDDAPIFQGRNGRPLSESQIRNVVVAATGRAKIAKAVSPHWFRHAHASHALDRNAPIHLVRDTLGHSSIATTGQYAHARPRESSGKYLGL